jgi:stearoyl-CoA desaturase (delta-9 desaturase)
MMEYDWTIAETQPGGEQLLLNHAISTLPSGSPKATDSGYSSSTSESDDRTKLEINDEVEVKLKDATRAFFGGMNNHSIAAREWMRCLRVAKLDKGD